MRGLIGRWNFPAAEVRPPDPRSFKDFPMFLNWFRKYFPATSRLRCSRPQAARKHGRPVRLSIETLEDRQLLSATVTNGVLNVTGNSGQSDVILLKSVQGHALEVTVNGVTTDWDNYVDP